MSRDGILYDENRESEKIARSFELSDRVDEIGRQDQERLSLSLSDVHRHIVRYEAQLTRHGVLSCPVKSLLEHNFGVHTKTTVIGGRRRYARSRLSTEDTKDLRDPAPSFRRVLLPGKHRRSSPRR